MTTALAFFSHRAGGKFRYQEFTTSGTFVPSAALLALGGQVMIDLRGGGGGYGSVYYNNIGGNGGNSKHISPATVSGPVTVTIGLGGTGSYSGTGSSGGTSSFGSISVPGGGGANGSYGGGDGAGNEGTPGQTIFYAANSSWSGPAFAYGGATSSSANTGTGGSAVSPNGKSGYCCVYWFETAASSATPPGPQPIPSDVSTLNITDYLSLNNTGIMQGVVVNTTSTLPGQGLINYDSTLVSVINLQISVSSGTNRQYSNITLTHDTINVYMSEINRIVTNGVLATFTATLVGNTISVVTTPTNAMSTYKIISSSL